jgi:hypothetical protein
MDNTIQPLDISIVADSHWFDPVAATNLSHPGGAARASLPLKVAYMTTPPNEIKIKPVIRTYGDLPALKNVNTAATSTALNSFSFLVSLDM